MTNHVNKGAQKSSVNQFGHDPNSAHEKSAKMEHFHKAHQEKAKKRVNELIHKIDAQFMYCASPLRASNPYSIFQLNHFYHRHLLATTASPVYELIFSTIFRTYRPLLNDVICDEYFTACK